MVDIDGVISLVLGSMAMIFLISMFLFNPFEEETPYLSLEDSVKMTCEKWSRNHESMFVRGHHGWALFNETGVCFGQPHEVFVFDALLNRNAMLGKACVLNITEACDQLQ